MKHRRDCRDRINHRENELIGKLVEFSRYDMLEDKMYNFGHLFSYDMPKIGTPELMWLKNVCGKEKEECAVTDYTLNVSSVSWAVKQRCGWRDDLGVDGGW